MQLNIFTEIFPLQSFQTNYTKERKSKQGQSVKNAPLLCIVALFFCSQNTFSYLFSFPVYSFLSHFLPPCLLPLFFCFLLSSPMNIQFFTFCLSLPCTPPLHPCDSLLSSQKPFLNRSVRSDPFHQPEKANYLPFYDFHCFTNHAVLYCWAVGSKH